MNTPSNVSFPDAASGAEGQHGPAQRRSTRLGRTGVWALLGGVALLTLWAGLAPLDEGVPTQATVAIDTKRKAVQHLQGGLVREVLVREGDEVKEGQPLMRLDACWPSRRDVIESSSARSCERPPQIR